MNFHKDNPEEIKKSIEKEKEYIKKHILKLYGGNQDKAALDLFVIDEIFKRADQQEPKKAKSLIDALKKKYERMKKERKWAKHGYILSVILTSLFALPMLLAIAAPIINSALSYAMKKKTLKI